MKWLNTTIVVHPDLQQPCEVLNYCPYGQLVEEFPIQEPRSSTMSCPIFGHDCPVHYHAELWEDSVGLTEEELGGPKRLGTQLEGKS